MGAAWGDCVWRSAWRSRWISFGLGRERKSVERTGYEDGFTEVRERE